MADQLVDQFRSLGIDDPEGWANSQRKEGINQIARATVLRAFADLYDQCGDIVSHELNDGRTPQVQDAAARLKASGADSADVTALAQMVADDMLTGVMALLDGAAAPLRNPAEINMALVRCDEDFVSTSEAIDGLHESWNEIVNSSSTPTDPYQ